MDFSRAQATPSASPSTGEYLLSAPLVKRDPANTRDHLVLEQTGVMAVHLQIFWRRVKPLYPVSTSQWQGR